VPSTAGQPETRLRAAEDRHRKLACSPVETTNQSSRWQHLHAIPSGLGTAVMMSPPLMPAVTPGLSACGWMTNAPAVFSAHGVGHAGVTGWISAAEWAHVGLAAVRSAR